MYEGSAWYPGRPLPFPCHQPTTDIVIPPLVDVGSRTVSTHVPGLSEPHNPTSAPSGTFPWSYFTHRRLLAIWRGAVTRGASTDASGVRQQLLAHFSRNTSRGAGHRANGAYTSTESLPSTDTGIRSSSMELRVSSRKLDHEAHYAEMRDSLFCLCPSGWAHWTVRMLRIDSPSIRIVYTHACCCLPPVCECIGDSVCTGGVRGYG